jgi:hypothetical protein
MYVGRSDADYVLCVGVLHLPNRCKWRALDQGELTRLTCRITDNAFHGLKVNKSDGRSGLGGLLVGIGLREGGPWNNQSETGCKQAGSDDKGTSIGVHKSSF